MKNIKTLLIVSMAGLLMAATSCSPKKDKSNKNVATEKKQEKIAVKTISVERKPVIRTIEYTASLIPFKEVYLAPSAPGKIEKIYVEIGDNVEKGDVVAEMDRTNLESARINLLNLETNYKRLETLKKTNTVSAQQYDQVKAAYEAAKVSYQFLLDNTRLKAPFSGIVSGKYFEDKENFTGAPNTPVGKPALISIVKINKLKAVFGVSARYYPMLSEKMKTAVTSDIYPDTEFSGEIYKIYPTVDPATKTVTVEVKVDNDGLKLRPGMFAKIVLTLGSDSTILIPTIAIIKQNGTNDKYVFVVENGMAKHVLIKTGQVFDDKTEILSGLKPGDKLVVAGQNKLMDKSPVKVIN
jgi:RND family efflux transporter MFP subunit